MSKNERKTRKVSLPAPRGQSRINVNELRKNFNRQISLPKDKDILPIYDPMEKAQDSVTVVRRKTGIAFDEKVMNQHFSLLDENFPESPNRLSSILRRCEELDLFNKCECLTPVAASPNQIKTVHSEAHYNILEGTRHERKIEAFKELCVQYDSVHFNQNSYEAATVAAGCALEVTKNVLEGKTQNGFAIIRPPGHHAGTDEFNGYCLLNNAAICAKYATQEGKRVLIVDWDVHHGQGIQRIFYDNPRVLYCSSHRYENGEYWPHLREGNFDYCGSGPGRGFNVNVPLNKLGLGNADFLAYFHQVLLPIAYEFSPDVVIVCAGFDAGLGDPLGEMSLTPAIYSHLTRMLMSLASGKTVVLLEGGYCLESLSEAAMLTLRTLMGLPCPRLLDNVGEPCQSMCDSILSVIHAQRQYWKCLKYQKSHTSDSNESLGDSTGDSIDLENIVEPWPKFTPKLVFEGPPPPAPGFEYPIITDDSTPQSEDEKKKFSDELQRLREGTCLNVAPNRVCLVYDEDMEKHFNYTDRSFPENPARTQEIMKKLQEFGILERVLKLQSRRAIRSELCLVHDNSLVDLMVNLGNLTQKERKELSDKYDSIYFNENTWDAARLATGSLLQVIDSVCTGESQNGIAVIRPPGHHAEKEAPNGFCFFNNVCIGAKYAMRKYGLKRILILDWDVHHGNGIQHCFEDSSSVLYISIHVYKGGNFFPFSPEGNMDYVGIGSGRGFNINIPWSKTGMKDGDYISALTQIVLPVGYIFDPDLVLVSAGFDAAINDPLGGCSVSPECYGHMTHMLSVLANGKVVLALEGGYNLTSISYCMTMCGKALLGDPLPPLGRGLIPSDSGAETISQVIKIHKEFWPCFKFQVSLPKNDDVIDSANCDSSNKGESSDAEFLTPPQSPPDVNTTTTFTPHMICRSDAESDPLVSGMASLNLSEHSTKSIGGDPKVKDIEGDPMVKDTGGDLKVKDTGSDPKVKDTGGHKKVRDTGGDPNLGGDIDSSLEGAVGVDLLTQLTIAQMMQDGGEFHAVIPLRWCPHLIEVNPVPDSGIRVRGALCEVCQDGNENWQCLSCYKVLCGRYVREHMVQHGLQEGHNIVLSHSDLSFWCYACESYVYNEMLFSAKDSATKNKFGE